MSNTPIPKSSNPDSPADNFKALFDLVKILRKECPWDIKQTNESIGPLMIEETYEVQDAIRNKDWNELSKELGDILLHVVMHSEIASEDSNKFNINDVIQNIHNKLVLRHPHVFGETDVSNEKDVLNNWETLKRKEGKKTALSGIPNELPALLRAERVQAKASRVGFDWQNTDGAWEKISEELQEIKDAIHLNDGEGLEEEIGDVLFSIVNVARKSGVVAEEALSKTTAKFIRRFNYIEKKTHGQGLKTEDLSLEQMDEYWNEAKQKGL
jgi:XTP/dITP diphosphohydrolase